MTRIGLMFLFGLALAGSVRADRPNVILVMADDLGWGDVSFNGGGTIRTPHLGAMSADGLTFTRFYAAAPVCSPTRGSCLTGRHPFRYGITHANVGHLPPEEPNLAASLKRQGYVTGHFGKWHLGTLTTEVRDANRGGPADRQHFSPPWLNCFDVCFSTESKVPTHDPLIKPRIGARPTWWDPVEGAADAVPYGTRYWDQTGRPVTEGVAGDDSRVVIDRTIPFVREAVAGRKPFFAVVWFHAPHLPVVAGPKYTGLYPDRTKFEQHYYGCVTALDEQVGRLRAELKRLGVERDTMLWFCSDNGPEGRADRDPGSAGPFRGRKQDLFEGGVRVPGVLVWPDRVEPGTTTDFPAVTSDYLPTILGRLGIACPEDRPPDGIDLWPAITGKARERAEPIGFLHRDSVAWVSHRYKLIRAGGEWMLFDLIDDPGETTDLAGSRKEVVAAMTEQFLAWKASVDRDRGN